MKIGLCDVDKYTTEYNGIKTPNLCLMKISTYHKQRGDEVEEWFPMNKYDLVYKAKVFINDRDIQTPIYADDIIQGGTGYSMQSKLPDEIEHIMPDYELFGITDTAQGFLTRGCPRGCPFCIVAEKEGRKSVKVADINEFWNGQKYISLNDPNILACKEKHDLLEQLVKTKSYVDFNQGLDIRLLDDDSIGLINKLKLKNIHFAWDNPKEDLTDHFIHYASKGTHRVSGAWGGVYVLVNYWSTVEEDLNRIYTLRDLGYDPYCMVYDKEHAPLIYKRMQRWCNSKFIFKSCRNFYDYKGGKA